MTVVYSLLDIKQAFCQPLLCLIPCDGFISSIPAGKPSQSAVSASVFWEVTVVFVKQYFDFECVVFHESPGRAHLSAEVLMIYWRSPCVLFDLKQECWGRRTRLWD